MKLTAAIDTRSVDLGIDGILKASKNLRPTFSQLSKEMKLDIKEHFEKKDGEGSPWPQLAASTQQKILGTQSRDKSGEIKRGRFKYVTKKGQLKKGGHKRLSTGGMLGRVKTAIEYSATNLYAEARCRIPWAFVQNDGGPVGKGATVPARKFFWTSPKFVTDCKEAILIALAKGWKA